jgi:hypothetical protein
MSETIEVRVPREAVGAELSRALGERGLRAAIVGDGDRSTLEVSFADPEHERLLSEVTHTIEAWLSERELPLVVQRTNGGCVVRPPSD